jgi:hypothetical protein
VRLNIACVPPAARAILPCLTIVAALGLSGAAQGSSIAYVDGEEVWVSSLDGTRKVHLSAGEHDWRNVTAADGGRVLGVRLEAGKISQLSKIQLWESNGTVLSQGPLPYSSQAWSSYAAPLSPDLSADGVFLAYGYSGYTGIVPNASFYSGHNVVNADNKTLLQPIGQSGYKWPTMFGRRVVAAQGSLVVAQLDGTGPFGTGFLPLLDTAPTGMSLERTDVAANGKVLAMELTRDAPDPDMIAVVSIDGVNAPVTFPAAVDCFVPAVGDATDVTLSQDGKRMAWKDAQGVKVAGVPTTADDPCVLSSPPVVISATGSHPSIGGLDVATLQPAAGTVPGGTGTPPGSATGFVLPPPPRVTVAALARKAGLAIKVTVTRAGKVTLAGTVPRARLGLKGKSPAVVAKGTATAKRAGTIKVTLRLTALARKKLKRLRGAKLTLRAAQGAQRATRIVTLR